MTGINLKVLDLSHHNVGPKGGDSDIDFQAIYAFGVRGIIHKASQGTGMVDKKYAKRRDAAKAAGLLWGAYHFATGDNVDDQVSHFIDSAQPDSQTILALDHEPNNGNQLDLDGARDFLEIAMDQLDRKLVLYSGNLIKEQLGNSQDSFFGSHRLWLAHYNNNPKWPRAWSSPWLHQFSGDGVNNNGITVPGLWQGNTVDMNSFSGSDDDLSSQWAT